MQDKSSALDKHDDGTEAGLASAKRIVERHGGRMGIESEPGQGSTFWLTLAPQ